MFGIEVQPAGRGGDSQSWLGLKGAVDMLHMPSGVSLPPAFTAGLTMEVVRKSPRIFLAKLLKHMEFALIQLEFT